MQDLVKTTYTATTKLSELQCLNCSIIVIIVLQEN